MSAVMPSQVVKILDRLFPTAAKGTGGPIAASDRFSLRVIVDLIEKVPEALLSISDDDYAELVVATSWMREHLEHWARNPEARYLTFDTVLSVRKVMVRCPDEFPPPTSTELSFVDDDGLRESIRNDIGATQRALEHAEWKAATVLAGASIEALLIWRLSKEPKAEVAASATINKLNVPVSLDEWSLGPLVIVAAHLKVIDKETGTAALLAKDFRNLIHPGRARRTNQVCDRGTTYSAVGAMERVIADLQK